MLSALATPNGLKSIQAEAADQTRINTKLSNNNQSSESDKYEYNQR